MQSVLPWRKRYALLIGLLLIFICTWSIDLILAAQHKGMLPALLPEWLALFVGYGFVIAAVAATWVNEGVTGIYHLLRRYTIWRIGVQWYLVALVGPVAIVLLAIGVAVLSGAPAPDFSRPFVRLVNGVPPTLALGWVALIWLLFEIFTNSEEIGWRGYVLPRLQQRYSPLMASLLLGVIWALWHLPKFWMGGAQEMACTYPFWLFTLDVVAQAVLYTWLYNHTHGSLLLATLLHASHNTAFMCLPIGLAVAGGAWPFFLAIALHCLWAAAVVAIGGTTLGQQVSAKVMPHHQVTFAA